MGEQNLAGGGSLARRLAFWVAGFVLVASLAMAVWMVWWFRGQELEEFRRSAETNVAFVEAARLPKSGELAGRLERILGCEVAFRFGDDRVGDWPAGLDQVVGDLAAKRTAAAGRSLGYVVAVAPFSSDGNSLVLFRKEEGWLPGSMGLVLAPTLLFSVVCAGLGILIARGIIGPLGSMAGWLPNLEKDETESGAVPLPEAISRRRDEIGELGRALEQTGERLRKEQRLRRDSERLATLGRIATSLAHEIKNPVAAIGLHADLLAQRADGEDAESVQLIREEVVRITDLVNQWLFVAHPKPRGQSRQELRKVVEDVGRRLAPILEHAGARLEFDSEVGEPVMVLMDAPRMEQVLRNLLINASQAMPEGGRIRVQLEVRDAGNEVALSVEDEGPGFSETALGRFGEAFYSEREGGMGIGLTLVCEVVRSHRGTVQAGSSQELGGARVVCCFPVEIEKGGEA